METKPVSILTKMDLIRIHNEAFKVDANVFETMAAEINKFFNQPSINNKELESK